MLAFEIPPSEMITVDYRGLSQDADISENQKDVLRQALSQIVPTSKEFFDANDAPPTGNNFSLYVRCVHCDPKADGLPVAVKLLSNDRSHSSKQTTTQQNLKFLVVSNDKKQRTWQIEIGPRRISWFAIPNLDAIPANGRLDRTSFSIKSCIDGIDCPKTLTFNSKDECSNALEKYFGKRLDLKATQTLQKREKSISLEKLPFQSDVKSQSQVRALLSSGMNSLTVKVQGRALKSGTVGDIIPVEIKAPSFSAQKTRNFEARISGEGEVEIVR